MNEHPAGKVEMDGDAAGLPASAPAAVIADVACAGCGCVCDDIEVTVADGRVVGTQRACELGQAWFGQGPIDARPAATISGRPASLDEAVHEAAQILAAAQYPLIYGLSDTTCEAQRVAVAIGDWLGGTVDSTTSVYHGTAGMAFQGVGEVTATLGEVRNRGDLIIFWGADPVVSHPRHLERYSLLPQGMFVPRGRSDRTCVVVDVRRTQTAEQADVFLQIAPGRDFEALWTLRALLKGTELDAAAIEGETGVPLAAWRGLVERLKAAHFGVLFFGAGLTMSAGRHLNGEAVLALTRDMNAFTRFVCLPLRERGNEAGADNVMLWTTGFPFGVNFSRGYPRYNPGEFTAADIIARGETDAVLLIAADPARDFGPAACEQIARIPCITLGPHDLEAIRNARVAFRTARYGTSAPGTVYRMDDVPIPLRPVLSASYPSDVEVLSRIEKQVKQLRGYGSQPLVRERSRLV